MKKIYFIIVLFMVNIAMLAQNNVRQSLEFDSIIAREKMNAIISLRHSDIVQFMGIPVDGTKKEMIRKLKKKGFKDKYGLGILEGEFNGNNVMIFIETNKKKVWRLAVVDAISLDADNIKTRFNNLCYQFYNNSKYYSMKDFKKEDNDSIPYTIPDDEDIAFNIEKQNKTYEASFSQRTNIQRADIEMLLSEGNLDTSMAKTWMCLEDLEAFLLKRVVFTIRKSPRESGYIIVMYYDNIYNQADGEDL